MPSFHDDWIGVSDTRRMPRAFACSPFACDAASEQHLSAGRRPGKLNIDFIAGASMPCSPALDTPLSSVPPQKLVVLP